ncbi:MAG: hypothetical protein QM725_05300 [Lacibacter sp.]
MKKWVWITIVIVSFSCGDKAPKVISDETLTSSDLVTLAKTLPFPVLINDTMLAKKNNDSSKINLATFKTFIPDSVFTKLYPSTKQLKLFVIGKIPDGSKGDFVLIKSVNGKVNAAQLYYFDKKNGFLGVLDVTKNLPKGLGDKYCRIDSKLNISFVQERKTPTGEPWTSETIYYMDASGKFIVAVTNSNEDLSDVIMGNPIDTLQRRNKFSADYLSDKKNLVSIRDGRTDKTFEFFIHFSKQNGDCVGEIKGSGEWTGTGKGIYREGTNGCAINFNFTSSSVSIKEENGCGSYRDITCFFEGTYPRKKEPAKKIKSGSARKRK